MLIVCTADGSAHATDRTTIVLDVSERAQLVRTPFTITSTLQLIPIVEALNLEVPGDAYIQALALCLLCASEYGFDGDTLIIG